MSPLLIRLLPLHETTDTLSIRQHPFPLRKKHPASQQEKNRKLFKKVKQPNSAQSPKKLDELVMTVVARYSYNEGGPGQATAGAH